MNNEETVELTSGLTIEEQETLLHMYREIYEQAAWSGHECAIIYLEDDYQKVLEVLKSNAYDTDYLEFVHGQAQKMYDDKSYNDTMLNKFDNLYVYVVKCEMTHFLTHHMFVYDHKSEIKEGSPLYSIMEIIDYIM